MLDMSDGVALGDEYIESYKNTIKVMIVKRLQELKYPEDEIRRIIKKIEDVFIEQRNGVKKGL